MVLAIARPWRHPKTGTYWFRRRVPKELLLLVGRSEERKSLRTKDPTLARTRYLLMAVEVDERWLLLRRGAAALAASPHAVNESADAVTNDHAKELQTRTGSFRKVPESVASTPSDVPVSPTSQRPVLWRPTFEAYAAEAKLAPSTVKRWIGIFVALEEAIGTDDLTRVTREDLIAWKRTLLAADRDPRTVRDAYIAAPKALMNWAVANGHLPSNPAAGVVVKVPHRPTTRDRDFTEEEARTILRAALGPHDPRLSPEHAAARRWIPWLCAYGGARVNEMTQLRGQDVRCEGGILFLRITPEAGRVKSGRWRDVPLHPHLVEQRFPEFVRSKGHGPLFYNPARSRSGQPAHPIYKKVGERLAAWVRSIGVVDVGVDPNHGWRHRFKTVGRRAGVSSDILDAIQGHAPRTEGEQYGRFPLETLYAAVSRLPEYDMKTR